MVSHISRKTSEIPNFLHAALGKTRVRLSFRGKALKIAEPTKLYRKSGVWATRGLLQV